MLLSNGADDTLPDAVAESNAAQKVTIDTQTTPIRVSPSNNRASTVKRRNTEMDSSELETIVRKAMRSNDRMTTLFAASPCAAIEQLNGVECVPGDLEANPESTAHQPTETINTIDVNDSPSDAVVMSTQSSEHGKKNEDIKPLHLVDDRQSNERRENITDYHIEVEKNSSGSICTDENANQEQKANVSHPISRKTIGSYFRPIHPIAAHYARAATENQPAASNGDYPETSASISCAKDAPDERNDIENFNKSGAGDHDDVNCSDAQQQTGQIVDEIRESQMTKIKHAMKSKSRKKIKKQKNKETAKSNAVDDVVGFPIKCRSRCRELLESTEAMEFHVESYHAKGIKRKISCHLCEDTFSKKNDLQKHMTAVHIGLRPFKCPFPKCSLAFARKDDLKRHTDAVHIGLRPFKCPFPKCSMAFTQKCHQQRHTNTIHTWKIAFKCTKCPSKFYHKRLLTSHLANKHGDGITYSCYLCKKSLGDKRQLRLHTNLYHTGQPLFHCPVCKRGFETKSNVERHMNGQIFVCNGWNPKSVIDFDQCQ